MVSTNNTFLDEGYITGNEKNYELLEHIEDEHENWEVESDHDQDEKGYDDASTNTEKSHDPAPVRNQTASQVNLMGMHKVSKSYDNTISSIICLSSL